MQQGDIIVNLTCGNRRKVLGISGEVMYYSQIGDYKTLDKPELISKMKEYNYTIDIPESEEETVTITINGKDIIISKKSAEALNLI